MPPLSVNLDAKGKQKAGKLKATATCSADCTLDLQASGKAGKKFTSKTTTTQLQAGVPTKVEIDFKGKVLRKIDGRRGKVTLSASATADDESATDTAKSKLKA